MYLHPGPPTYISRRDKRTYQDPEKLGSFRAHYEACRNRYETSGDTNTVYDSVYELLLDKSLIICDDTYHNLILNISQKVDLSFRNPYSRTTKSSTNLLLQTWNEIDEIQELAEYLLIQIEKFLFY